MWANARRVICGNFGSRARDGDPHPLHPRPCQAWTSQRGSICRADSPPGQTTPRFQTGDALSQRSAPTRRSSKDRAGSGCAARLDNFLVHSIGLVDFTAKRADGKTIVTIEGIADLTPGPSPTGRGGSADIYKRWAAFGLLSSHSRLHGSSSYRVPWAYDEEAVSVLSKFTKLKCSLMPYLYRAALQAHEKGTPVLRAMMLEFPDDPACDHLDLQYMLGDSLLVAPVFSHDGSFQYYVPKGRWTNLLNGNVIEGPRWVKETHDFMSLPLLVRPNSVLPIGSRTDRPDYDYGVGVTLQVYQLEDGKQARTEIPTLDGKIETSFDVRREGNVINIQRQGLSKAWNVVLIGIDSVEKIESEEIEMVNGSIFVRVNGEINELAIRL